MITVQISNTALKRMLNITKRKQTVNGKQQAQVEACSLICNGTKAYIRSLTRDLTGLTWVNAEASSSEPTTIPLPDIDRVLGILALHGENLRLEHSNNKLRIRSSGKQTTLDASFEAKAFSHSQETLFEFSQRSKQLAEKIDAESGTYTMGNGGVVQSFCSFAVNVADLYDACRCDTINGQRLNRFTFKIPDGREPKGMEITVGDPSLGQTTSEIVIEEKYLMPTQGFSWDFDGGLDELFKSFTGKAKLNFFDFREYDQGIRFSVSFGNGEWAWAAGVLG